MAVTNSSREERALLQVSTEELCQKAEQLQKATEKLWQSIYQIESKVNRTKGYWYGAAGDSCRSAFAGPMSELKQACSALSGYPGKLCEVAGVYTTVEAKNQTAAGALGQNIL